jgi:hypothetical protein
MKAVLFILVLTVVGANAQQQTKDIGLDFIKDNLLIPMINNMANNTVHYLGNSFTNFLSGWFGKREEPIARDNLLTGVVNLYENYSEKVEKLIFQYGDRVQALVGNIFQQNFDFSALLSQFDIELRKESYNLVNALYQLFQMVFGEKFLELNKLNSRNVFTNISNIINTFATTINQSLNNISQQLVQTVTHAAQVSTPFLAKLNEKVLAGIHVATSQLQQFMGQISGNFSA